MVGTLVIESPGGVSVAPDEAPWRFGRDAGCDLVIGADDRTISRHAGAFVATDTGWVLRNESSLRPIYLVGATGLRVTLPPRDDAVLASGTSSVLVVGTLTHEIRVVAPGPSEDAVSDSPTALDLTDEHHTIVPSLTDREREAIAALASRFFLPPPRHESRPLTYAEAGALLGVPPSTVRKRLERVRAKLAGTGVAGMEADDARAEVCDFLLATGLVTADDLGPPR